MEGRTVEYLAIIFQELHNKICMILKIEKFFQYTENNLKHTT